MKKKQVQVNDKRMMKFWIAFTKAFDVLPYEERKRIIRALAIIYNV